MLLNFRISIFAAALVFGGIAQADRPQWAYQSFVFDQKMQMDDVFEVTHVAPQNLTRTIQSKGVDILLVKDGDPAKSLNPSLKGLTYATEDLLTKAEFQASYEGRMMPANSPCCALDKDTILIKDTASNYTLIHEYLHSALRLTPPLPQVNLESAFKTAERKQLFYQRKLFENPVSLLNPAWRRDIHFVQEEIISMLYDRIRIGQAQEAIIEKVLSRYIDEKSPYYDLNRKEQGLKYAEAMINNAITVFNNLHFSITWNQTTTAELASALEKGEIETVEKNESLTAEEAKAFDDAANAQIAALEKTKREILQMKSFFTK